MLGVFGGRKTREPRVKPSQASKARTNNKLDPYMALGQNRTQAAVVEGEHIHRCAISAPYFFV